MHFPAEDCCNVLTPCVNDSRNRIIPGYSYQSQKIYAQEDPNNFEICDNFVDDDGDGLTDFDDPEGCSPSTDQEGTVLPETTTTAQIEICDNFFDDDGDGFVDAEDPDWTTPPTTDLDESVAPEQAVPSVP